MTHDELRDELARAMGWDFRYNSWWHPTEPGIWYHHVPRTADGALAAWDRLCGNDWQPWTRESDNGVYWYATLQKGWDGEEYPTVKDTGNFAHDLCALTLAAVRAKGGEADGK